jgi:uncharacterized membrane protein
VWLDRHHTFSWLLRFVGMFTSSTIPFLLYILVGVVDVVAVVVVVVVGKTKLVFSSWFHICFGFFVMSLELISDAVYSKCFAHHFI